MTRQKENALADYIKMISHAWTWNRLTEEEKKRFTNNLNSVKLRGTYLQRWETLNNLYYFYLAGIDYKPSGWRETDEEAPQF